MLNYYDNVFRDHEDEDLNRGDVVAQEQQRIIEEGKR
jgi:hypothetical protein